MGILIARRTMGRPAGVPDPHKTMDGAGWYQPTEPLVDLPLFFADLELAIAHECDSGAIVTAIFKTTKTLQQDGSCVSFSDVAYDSTHVRAWY